MSKISRKDGRQKDMIFVQELSSTLKGCVKKGKVRPLDLKNEVWKVHG